jgi:hypothetical protein
MPRTLNPSSARGITIIIKTLAASAAACAAVPVALSAELAPTGVVKLSYSLQVITKAQPPTTDPACPIKVLIDGVGLTNLLGPIHDEQSHCVMADGTVENGVFTYTGATLGGLPGGEDSGDSITGMYRAHQVPSLTSELTNPPGGYWLGYGEVCIWKGTGKFAGVINDCPTASSLGQFFPARLSVDFTTGLASIFGTAVVRFTATE